LNDDRKEENNLGKPLKRQRNNSKQTCKEKTTKNAQLKRIKLAKLKKKKQSVVSTFLSRMKVEEAEVKKLNSRQRSDKEFEDLEIY